MNNQVKRVVSNITFIMVEQPTLGVDRRIREFERLSERLGYKEGDEDYNILFIFYRAFCHTIDIQGEHSLAVFFREVKDMRAADVWVKANDIATPITSADILMWWNVYQQTPKEIEGEDFLAPASPLTDTPEST